MQQTTGRRLTRRALFGLVCVSGASALVAACTPRRAATNARDAWLGASRPERGCARDRNDGCERYTAASE